MTDALVIAGPTASGKSRLALALADRWGGAVVNADSMQVYRELSVLTARPGAAVTARAPHALYGVLPASERCSVARWRALALEAIAAARAAERLPILVGGTGLYLRSLVFGLAEIPPVPVAVRAAAEARWRGLGPTAFHAELADRDPAAAARIAPADRQRLTRAWEVFEATGRALSDWQRAPPKPALDVVVVVLDPPRATLNAACDLRFLAMIEAGALDEVRALLALGLDPSLPAMKAVGVRELAAHAAGRVSLEAAVAAAQRATRAYAKRQRTWFRHQMAADLRFESAEAAEAILLQRGIGGWALTGAR